MDPDPETSVVPTGWAKLDPYVRLMILDTIWLDQVDILGLGLNSKIRKKRVGRLASVSREWQEYIEKQTFSHLTLTKACLAKFERIATSPNRRNSIRHISLLISAPGSHQTFDATVITSTISQLFRILSKWDNHEPELVKSARYQGLTLELTVVKRHPIIEMTMFDAITGPDGTAGWHRDAGGRELLWALPRNSQPFEWTPEASLGFGQHLPEIVTIVRSLVLRRQTRDSIGPAILQDLFKCLPQLERVTYKPWLHVQQKYALSEEHEWGRHGLDQDYARLLRSIPPHIKQVTLFEDFDVCWDPVQQDTRWEQLSIKYNNGPPRTPSPAVAAALAVGSTHLEALSASYIVDAEDFFLAIKYFTPTSRSFFPSITWDNLSHLSLTSKLFAHPRNTARVHETLLLAARAAVLMPRLRVLEIWYALEDLGVIFQYRIEGVEASIAWCGTWISIFTPEVITAWEDVAKLHVVRPLVVQQGEVISPDRMWSHGHAVSELGLRGQIMHPASMMEIRKENHRGGHMW